MRKNWKQSTWRGQSKGRYPFWSLCSWSCWNHWVTRSASFCFVFCGEIKKVTLLVSKAFKGSSKHGSLRQSQSRQSLNQGSFIGLGGRSARTLGIALAFSGGFPVSNAGERPWLAQVKTKLSKKGNLSWCENENMHSVLLGKNEKNRGHPQPRCGHLWLLRRWGRRGLTPWSHMS